MVEEMSEEQRALTEKQNIWDGYDEDVGILHDSHKTAYRPDKQNRFGVMNDDVVCANGKWRYYVPDIYGGNSELAPYRKKGSQYKQIDDYGDPLLDDDVNWVEPEIGIKVVEDDFGKHFVPYEKFNVYREEKRREQILFELEREQYTREYWDMVRSTRGKDVKTILTNAVSKAYNASYKNLANVRFHIQREQMRKNFLLLRKQNLKDAFTKVCRLNGLNVDDMKQQIFGTSDLSGVRPSDIEDGAYTVVDLYVDKGIKQYGIK